MYINSIRYICGRSSCGSFYFGVRNKIIEDEISELLIIKHTLGFSGRSGLAHKRILISEFLQR